MSKKYTKKQIAEAIAYWEKRLDESTGGVQKYFDRLRGEYGYAGRFPSEVWFQTRQKFETEFGGNEVRQSMGDLYDVVDSMFARGCKYAAFIDDAVVDDNVDFDAAEELYKFAKDCPEPAKKLIAADVKHRGHDTIYVVGFGDDVSDQAKHKFKVVTDWYRPVQKEDFVDAADEDEAEQIVDDMYCRSTKSRSDSDWTYEGVVSVDRA